MNTELKEIYEEDKKDRLGNFNLDDPGDLEKLRINDENRKKRVKELMDGGKIQTSEDFHHAALIFQHGESSDDFKQANELAKKSIEMGDDNAKWLYAATLDRYLLSSGKAQKFGTQFKLNDKQEWELAPVDSNTTDEERAEYSVPPISKALEEFNKKYQKGYE